MKTEPVRGTPFGNQRRIAIPLTDEQFRKINRRAEISGRSFTAELKALMEWAMSTAPPIKRANVS